MGSLFEIILIRLPTVFLALTVHELAHGLTARWLGDPTAEKMGRLTFNPLGHIDLLGTMMLIYGPFGWAKPVPVNVNNLKHPRRDMAIVAAAGPAANILLAVFTAVFFRIEQHTGNIGFIKYFYRHLFAINIGLALFNLLPVYPLDGSRIVMSLLNRIQLKRYIKMMKVVPWILIGLITVEWLIKDLPLFSKLIEPVFMPVFIVAQKYLMGI